MYKNTTNKTKSNKKILIFFTILLFLIFTGLIVYSLARNDNPPETQTDGINYGPATEEEIQAAEDNKSRLVEEQKQQNQAPPPQQNSNQKTGVTLVFGYIEVRDGQVNSNGFISTIIEEGGTCTLTLKKGSRLAQATSLSLADAQSTVCGLMQINTSELSGGEWSATISYSSDKYEGVSEERLITVE
jgi:hypothetical protein